MTVCKWILPVALLAVTASALPVKGPAGSWNELRRKNLSIGLSPSRVDHTLETCRGNGLSVKQAEELLHPVYMAYEEGLPTDYIFMKIEEGLAKHISWKEIHGEAGKRLTCLQQADELTRNVKVKPCEKREHLVFHTCLAIESGLPRAVLKDLFQHKGSECSGRLVYLVEVAERLQLNGLPCDLIQLLLLDCLDHDLNCSEITRVVSVLEEQLATGKSFEQVHRELWIPPAD